MVSFFFFFEDHNKYSFHRNFVILTLFAALALYPLLPTHIVITLIIPLAILSLLLLFINSIGFHLLTFSRVIKLPIHKMVVLVCVVVLVFSTHDQVGMLTQRSVHYRMILRLWQEFIKWLTFLSLHAIGRSSTTTVWQTRSTLLSSRSRVWQFIRSLCKSLNLRLFRCVVLF